MKTKFVVRASQAKMSAKCWGKYGRVAVMEMEEEAPFPAMISEHARGCVRVVRVWDRLFWGISERCAFRQAVQAAKQLARQLEEERCEP